LISPAMEVTGSRESHDGAAAPRSASAGGSGGSGSARRDLPSGPCQAVASGAVRPVSGRGSGACVLRSQLPGRPQP
jgi:hypothetical protein